MFSAIQVTLVRFKKFRNAFTNFYLFHYVGDSILKTIFDVLILICNMNSEINIICIICMHMNEYINHESHYSEYLNFAPSSCVKT